MSENRFELLYQNELNNKLSSHDISIQKDTEFTLSLYYNGADCLHIATRNSIGTGFISLEILNDRGKILRKAKTNYISHNGYTTLKFEPLINCKTLLGKSSLTFKLKCIGGCGIISDGSIPGMRLYKTNMLFKDEYSCWLNNNMPNYDELLQQRMHKFEYEPLISIVIPLYNTPDYYLRDMLDSIINQTYTNWELCLADGSDSKTNIDQIIAEYNDERIKCKKLESNQGISLNTNAAIDMANGEYIAFMDHDDMLAPHALFANVSAINENLDYELIYSDEDKLSEDGIELYEPYFKPDFSPHLLLSYNYITHFTVIKRNVLNMVGNLKTGYDGAQDYDLLLRVTEKAKKIKHISDILYHWRSSEISTAGDPSAKLYTIDAGRRAINDALKRRGIKGEVYSNKIPNRYRINYFIDNPEPLVSIIIPNKNEYVTLKACINSITEKTQWNNYEIIIVENNSDDENLFDYYDRLSKQENIRIIKWNKPFNYSALNNFGVNHANGNLLLFMNNDMTIINSDWLIQMAMLAQQPEIGAVGAKLLYPDNRIQHAGVIVRMGGVAGHPYVGMPADYIGPFANFTVVRDVGAVTGACVMVRSDVFHKAEGFTEALPVAFNDVDFCLKILELGYYNIYTPFAQLYHYESKTRGYEDTPEKIKRFQSEIKTFLEFWEEKYPYDPFYNRNLKLELPGYEINPNKVTGQNNFKL